MLVPVYTPTSVKLVAANDPVPISVVHNGSQFSFSFTTTMGLTYAVEYTDSLSAPDWQPLTGGGSPDLHGHLIAHFVAILRRKWLDFD